MAWRPFVLVAARRWQSSSNGCEIFRSDRRMNMIKTVGVLGAGQMGNGIAHVFAQHGHDVVLFDIAAGQLEKAVATIRQNLERQAKKGAIAESLINATLGRIRTTQDLADLAPVDFAVEAVTEHEPLKLEIFRRLDETV